LDWYNKIVTPDSGGLSTGALATEGSNWVDVRDLADAHLKALEVAEAGGQRFIVDAGSFKWQDWLDCANSLTPSPLPHHILPKGNPGAGSSTPTAVHLIKFDASKGEDVFGLTYRTMQESTRDTLSNFSDRGW